jgi:hypothetical protein
MSIATLLTAAGIPAQAQENLIYVAVEPCRLVETRPALGGAGPIPESGTRNFLVYGDEADLSSQGGAAGGCAHPREDSGVEPLAISAYVVGVPTATSGAGHLTAYPSDGPEPDNASATVNYEAQQVNGNTTNVTLCQPGPTCPTDGQMAIKAFTTDQNVVIDVQGYFYPATGTCPDDMVAVGSLCVDKYEASVTNAAGDTQYGLVWPPNYPCAGSGRDCGATEAGNANAIYARSVADNTPSAQITWWQAAQACANVGKHLPTSAEWQAAASGTPSGTATCNLSGTLAFTRSLPACVSSTGAFDMIGNLWEWVADMDNNPAKTGFTSINSFQAWAMGDSFNNDGDAGATTRDLWVEGLGNTSSRRGLRCVR